MRWFETFEATGYDLGIDILTQPHWGSPPTTSGGSTIDPDAATSAAGSPPLWGSQCMKIDHVASTDAFLNLALQSAAAGAVVSYVYSFAAECVFTAATLTDGANGSVIQGLLGGVSYWRFRTTQISGVQMLEVQIKTDGTTFVTVWGAPLVLNTVYRVEVTWSADQYEVRIGGRVASKGTLTSTAVGKVLDTFAFGTVASSVNAFTVYIDRIEFDSGAVIDDRRAFPVAISQRAG